MNQPASIPAWTYQAPACTQSHPDQLYYRSFSVYLEASYPEQCAPNPKLALLRMAKGDTLALTVDTGCGSARIQLDQAGALMLRDALNDAIEDGIKAQLVRAAQQLNQAEVPA